MFGMHIKRHGECIEKVSKETEELSLLAKGDGVEIMYQRIRPEEVFYIDPGEDKNLMEFFYIISGNAVWENGDGDVELVKGDYFYVNGIEDSTHFRTVTEVEMIYVASQPVFHFLSKEIERLCEIRKMVEEKDMYTHEHEKRLEKYSIRIGEKLHLSKKQLDVLCYSAGFHDIGKINVPDEILKKPSRLTNEEFEHIKKHPMDGVDMIKDTFLKECVPAILQHHERLDGSGYPRGLREDEICIEAKIIAVIDTYDAMTSDRPYRMGMDTVTALKEIKSLVGKHYDYEVVKHLEEILIEDGIIDNIVQI